MEGRRAAQKVRLLAPRHFGLVTDLDQAVWSNLQVILADVSFEEINVPCLSREYGHPYRVPVR